MFRSPEERNLNGHKGTLPVRQREEKAAKENNQDPTPAGRVNHRAGSKPSIRPNAMKNRGKQLEALKQMEERIQRLKVFHQHEFIRIEAEDLFSAAIQLFLRISILFFF